MKQWLAQVEQELLSASTAFDMLMRMCDSGDYNTLSLRAYRERLMQLHVLDPPTVPEHVSEALTRVSQEDAMAAQEAVDRLRGTRESIVNLLDVMQSGTSDESNAFLKMLGDSSVRKQLIGKQQVGEEKDGYQFDNVSIASSLWSVEANASVKRGRRGGREERKKKKKKPVIHQSTSSEQNDKDADYEEHEDEEEEEEEQEEGNRRKRRKMMIRGG